MLGTNKVRVYYSIYALEANVSCFKCGYTQMFMLDMKVTPTALNTLTGVSIYSFRKIVNLLGIEIVDIYIIMLCFIANCLLSSLKKNILATKLKKKSQNFQCFFLFSKWNV